MCKEPAIYKDSVVERTLSLQPMLFPSSVGADVFCGALVLLELFHLLTIGLSLLRVETASIHPSRL